MVTCLREFCIQIAVEVEAVRLVYGDECSSDSCGEDVGLTVDGTKAILDDFESLGRILIEIT